MACAATACSSATRGAGTASSATSWTLTPTPSSPTSSTRSDTSERDLVGRDLLYSLILRRVREFNATGRVWTGYDYTVPGQAQGRFDKLLVIGDKRGGGTTKRLRSHPELLDRLERLVGVGVPVRMVHVIRDPFDTIASMHRRGRQPLSASIDRFFDLCDTNASIRARRPEAVTDVRLEDLVAEPGEVVRRLVDFLGLDASPDYLAACAAVVFDAPRRARTAVEWSERQVADVQARMQAHDFLRGYGSAG